MPVVSRACCRHLWVLVSAFCCHGRLPLPTHLLAACDPKLYHEHQGLFEEAVASVESDCSSVLLMLRKIGVVKSHDSAQRTQAAVLTIRLACAEAQPRHLFEMDCSLTNSYLLD